MKDAVWVGSSLDDLRRCPKAVRVAIGHALDEAQKGRKASYVKPLKGFTGASVLEVVENRDGDTYRGVYTVTFKDAIYVLHVFKKKSKRGIATPKAEINLIRERLKWAQELSKKETNG